ncbi:MAG: CPBP family intramembrane metalloprotease [Tannerella sp.]|jgi:hypothetical protein|nr:CPBP family intramembrane metalloprotease [Tannerella sp.]
MNDNLHTDKTCTDIPKHKKLKLGLALFLLGFTGILSLLTVSIPFPEEALKIFSPAALKLLSLIQPSVLLLVAVVTGTALYEKVGLSVPTISSLLKIETPRIRFFSQFKHGALFGIAASLLVMIISFIFSSAIPDEPVGNKMELTPIARFCYGGITEELLMRFGFMTFIVWIVSRITKKLNRATCLTGIVVSALLFALGHFPVVFVVIPHPTVWLLAYILIGNSIAGIAFGWLYWKKGLESAFVAHVFFHAVVIISNLIHNYI